MNAKQKKFNEAVQEILDAGQGLSNVCFNLSQVSPDAPMKKSWLISMRAAWVAWDRALRKWEEARRKP